MRRIIIGGSVMLLCLSASALHAFGAEGGKIWGPSTITGSNNPAYTVTTTDGMVAVAGTKDGVFALIFYNATSGNPSTVGNLPNGIVKGIATDGTNIFIGGTQTNATGNNTGIVTLYDSSAVKNTKFPKTIDYGNGSYADGGISDIACAAGIGIVTGTSYNNTNLLIKTVAYNTTGTTKVLKEEGSSTDNYTAVAIAADSSYIAVVGIAENATDKDIVIFFYDYNNAKQWGERFDSTHNETAIDVALDSNHNVYVLGRVFNDTQANWDSLLLKYDSSGNLKWEKWFDMNDQKKDDFPAHIVIDSNDYVIVAGYYALNQNDYFVAKFNSEGNEEWSISDGYTQYEDKATAVAIDPNNNIVVTGYSNDGTKFRYHTLCLNATGTVKWSVYSNNTENYYATAIATTLEDEDVIVVVAGYTALNYISTIAYEGCDYEEDELTNELPSGNDRIIEIDHPQKDPDADNHTYIGLGEVVDNPGTTMKIALEFPCYTDSSGNPIEVNIYVALGAEVGGVFYLAFLNPEGKFELLTADNPLEPWKKNVNEEIDEVVIQPFSLKDPLFGNPLYPDLTYWFYTLVVPSNIKDDLSNLEEDTRYELTYFSIDLY